MLRNLLLLGLVALAGYAAQVPGLVEAHSRPIRFDPPPGAVLTSAPSKVEGWFINDLRRDPNWNFIHVTDPQGNRVDTGDPILSSDRRQMSVNLKPGLASGQYIVAWRSWDDEDGEIFGTCHTFFIGQEAFNAAVTARAPMDGGAKCDNNLEVSAKTGTPTPKQIADAQAEAAESGHSESGGISILVAAVGGILGVSGGGIGGYFVARRFS